MKLKYRKESNKKIKLKDCKAKMRHAAQSQIKTALVSRTVAAEMGIK